MEATRILPDLQCSLLCEDIRQEATGNFILVGILNHIRVPQLPVTALKICVFNRWTAGVGSFVERVRLIAQAVEMLQAMYDAFTQNTKTSLELQHVLKFLQDRVIRLLVRFTSSPFSLNKSELT